MWFVQFYKMPSIASYKVSHPLTWVLYNENLHKVSCSVWQLTSDRWILITEQSAKLQKCKGQSQGKGCWEVRIYTIKNGVKYLTVVRHQRTEDRSQRTEVRGQRTEDRGQKSEDSSWRLTTEFWKLTTDYWTLIFAKISVFIKL